MATKSKTKIYAIAKGPKTGIFQSWDEVKELVDGSPDQIYKSFFSRTKAIDFLRNHGIVVESEAIQDVVSSQDLSDAESDEDDQFLHAVESISTVETDMETDMKTVKSELADMKDMLMKLIEQLDEKKDPAIECTHEAFKSKVEALETDNADLRAKNVELRALLEESRSTSARANDMQSSGIQIPRQTSRQPVETTITTSNRYSALSSRGTDDEEPVITGSQSSRGDEAPETTGHRSTRRANQTSRRVPPNQRDGSRDQPEPEQTQRAAIMIIGDSIIKQIDPKKTLQENRLQALVSRKNLRPNQRRDRWHPHRC